jgi:hypothetical protein
MSLKYFMAYPPIAGQLFTRGFDSRISPVYPIIARGLQAGSESSFLILVLPGILYIRRLATLIAALSWIHFFARAGNHRAGR